MLHHFDLISEAYEVLSDPLRKANYDKFGEDGLKNGFFSQGEMKGGYRYQRRPFEVFNKFYLEENPLAKICDEEGRELPGSMFGFAFGNQKNADEHKPEHILLVIECTLSELYNGCSKTVEYERQVMNTDERSTSIVILEKQVNILPGYGDQTELVFKHEGNQAFGYDAADLIIKIASIPHPTFKRVHNDLIYTAKINLIEALSCCPLSISTLDGRELHIPVDKIIQPNKGIQKIVKGEGFPIHETAEYVKNPGKKNQKRGDLKIMFETQFPQLIPQKY